MFKAKYHLPGLFEFYDFYKEFLPFYQSHKEYFYDWCEIASIYGAPIDCLWAGGRLSYSEVKAKDVSSLMDAYGIAARLTFSNSLLMDKHLEDKEGNALLEIFHKKGNGIIITSDKLLSYIQNQYPLYQFISSTTKVLLKEEELLKELEREAFAYVVPDFRWNPKTAFFENLTVPFRSKVELLCNESCDFSCKNRKACYESVSRKALGEDSDEFVCASKQAKEGYVFSRAMEGKGFIGIADIQDKYLPMGITNFKIEGRDLGSALLLEFILYYMTKPADQLKVREALYLHHSLDLF